MGVGGYWVSRKTIMSVPTDSQAGAKTSVGIKVSFLSIYKAVVQYV